MLQIKCHYFPFPSILHITDLDTLLQPLIENKACYLEVKVGFLLFLLGKSFTCFPTPRKEFEFDSPTVHEQISECND